MNFLFTVNRLMRRSRRQAPRLKPIRISQGATFFRHASLSTVHSKYYIGGPDHQIQEAKDCGTELEEVTGREIAEVIGNSFVKRVLYRMHCGLSEDCNSECG
jgi:hypothetical protein